MALFGGPGAAAVLFGVQPSGTGWLGWVVVAVAVVFMVLILVGDFRRGLRARIARWRTRDQHRSDR
jgi:hypothetical protein